MENDSDKQIYIRTFGGFDVFVDGKLVYFSSSKAKELLAILVEKWGSSVSLAQMTYLLYEHVPEQTAKNSLRVVYFRLKKCLEEYGIEHILIKKRGSFAVDTDQFVCDLYEFVRENPEFRTSFAGSYMPEYPWSKEMLPYLKNLYQKYNGETL